MLSLLPVGFCGLAVEAEGLLRLGVWFGTEEEEEGGRQNSSKRSASRGDCMWM